MTTARTGAPAGRAGVSVPVDDLAPEMVLAEDVRDQQGRLLIPAETALTDRHLRAFQLWGIASVRVKGAGVEEVGPPPLSPELLAEAEATMAVRLRHNDPAHPMIAELRRCCVQDEARRLAEERRHA
jgi:hypothetical protein